MVKVISIFFLSYCLFFSACKKSDSVSKGKPQVPKDSTVVPSKYTNTFFWERTLGTAAEDWLMSVSQAKDGGYIIGGIVSNYAKGIPRADADYLIIKVDAAGNELWSKRLGGTHDERLRIVKVTTDGGYLIGGESSSNKSGDKSEDLVGDKSERSIDCWIVKLDSKGNKLWDKNLGTDSNDRLDYIGESKDGGYVLGGNSGNGFYLIKLNKNGSKEWEEKFSNNILTMNATSDGGYIFAGTWFESFAAGSKRADIFFKSDQNGVVEWEVRRDSQDGVQRIVQAKDGNYIYVTGRQVVGLNEAGFEIWKKDFPNNFSFSSMTADDSDGFFLIGYSATDLKKDTDYDISKWNSTGNLISAKAFGGDKHDAAQSMEATSDGGFIIGGYSFSGKSVTKFEGQLGQVDYPDFWVVKLKNW